MEPMLLSWLDTRWADVRLVKWQWLEQDLAAMHCGAEAREIV